MLRPTSFNTRLIEQKPRKRINVDVINDKSYNQFEGNSHIDIEELKNQQYTRHNDFFDQQTKNNKTIKQQLDIGQEISQYSKIFTLVSRQGLKFKKVDQKNTQNNNQNQQSKNKKAQQNSVKLQRSQLKKQQLQQNIPRVKFEQGQQQVQQIKIQNKQKQKSNSTPITKVTTQPSSNWKKFMQQSTVPNNKGQSLTTHTKFISIDCQFVKCGESDQLARISLISQHGQTLYDSYIKPSKRVTDYITDITGITFSHLKNAPSWQQQIGKVKKILINKILVGHTLHKDLQVCGLTSWKGISQKIDIAQFSEYREKNGSKIVSLKRMALSFLNRNIQSGWHSSVEDATVTMDLFKLNKKKMLKQFKII